MSDTPKLSPGIPNHLVLSTGRYMPTWTSKQSNPPETKPEIKDDGTPVWRE